MKKLLLLAAVGALFNACSDDDPRVAKTPTTIQISPLIATVSTKALPDTRTAITGSTAAWTNNDAIGLYCAQSDPAAVNDQFTVTGLPSSPVWTPATAIYWIDGTTAHKFLAYAPYASGNTDPTAVKLPAINTQTGTINPAHDVLISNNQYSTGVVRTGSVALTFTHALALIEYDIILGAGIAAGTTLASTVTAGAAAEKLYTTDATSTINLTSGAITVAAGSNTATVTPGTPPTLSSTATPFYTLIVPGTYTGPTLTVNIKEGGSTSLTTATVPVGTTIFQAGRKYTYQVTVSRTAITISTPTITDWTSVPGTAITPGI